MDLHLELDRSAGGLAAQVAAGLREAIRQERLAAGSRLPPTRQLATDLAVSRGVVVEAYEQLAAEGFLHTRVGSGTVVAQCASAGAGAADPPRSTGDAPIEFELRPGTPDLKLFPRDQWLARYRQTMSTMAHDRLGYPDPAGDADLRRELAAYLNRVRSAQATPSNVVVAGGVSMALSLVVRALAERGHRRLAVEDPTGVEYRRLIGAAGVSLVSIPVDDEGLDVAALAASDASIAVLTPAHQYPLGVVLSARRRHELVAWAAARDGFVIEDDYDAEFRFDREAVGSLQGLAPERVVLTGSVSKALSPAVRLGWLVAPPWLASASASQRRLFDLGSPVLDQQSLARFLADGGYDRHLRKARRTYRSRRDAMVRALTERLAQLRLRGISAGLHLFAELPSGLDDVAVAEAAAHNGVGVLPVTPMRTKPGPPGLVLCFAREPETRLREAVHRLARSIE